MIALEPVGHVHSVRQDLVDDDWGPITADIELCAGFSGEALQGLEAFSHAEVLFHFDRVAEGAIERGARHPRGNPSWPKVGIFAQRGKDRPNRLGSTIVEIVARQGRILTVRGLDAVDGTPVLDIKPVMAEFLPRTPVRQPAWSRALMQDYWVSRPRRAQQLVRAACSNDVARAATWLAADPTLSGFDVFTASACGDVEKLTRILVVDPTAARTVGGPLGAEPIVHACFSRFLRFNPARAAAVRAAVRLLLDHGADPNAHFFEAPSGAGGRPHLQTCIYAAAGIANDATLTRLLLDAGAQIRPDDDEVLYHSAEFHDVACLALVLDAGPGADTVSYCLGRALDFDNEPGALLFLNHGADPNRRIPWDDNRSHLHKAAINGRSLATVAAMLDRGGDPNATDARGLSPHRHAVRRGHQHLVRLFEARGADVGSASADDRATGAIITGQSVTVPPGFVPDPGLLSWAAGRNDLIGIRGLLAAGCDVNGHAAMPPLHAACWSGHLEATELLLDRGARLGLRNEFGGTELGAAVHGSSNCFDVEGGVGMKLPAEVAHGRYPEVVERLIAAGAALPAAIGDDGSAAVKALLRRHGVPDAAFIDGP